MNTAPLPAEKVLLDGFATWLGLERGLSENTLRAYIGDVSHLLDFILDEGLRIDTLREENLHTFLALLSDMGIAPRSLARVIAGIRSFYRYLRLEGYMQDDPTALLEPPRMGRALPDVLSTREIDAMIAAIPDDKVESLRNRAIIETLYGSGLRVSELVDARMSHLDLDEGLLLVEGKGSKQRVVPMSHISVALIREYIRQRAELDIKPDSADVIFLNRRGRRLTRVMVYYIIRDLAAMAGIERKVSPHTLRHSFATHLLEGGASLSSIRAMLGHESIATTEIYVHTDRSRLMQELMAHHPHFTRGE